MSDFSEDDLIKFKKFKEMMEIEKENPNFSVSTEKELEQKFAAFLKKSEKFEVGDIVKWKEGLKNKKYPKEGQLCMVLKELEKPLVQDTKDSGSPYYMEPLDLVLALLDDDSDFVIFHYDKRRFELVKKANKQ
jgi:hypothetical protein